MKDVKDLNEVELISLVTGVNIDLASKLYEHYSNDIVEMATCLAFPNIEGITQRKTRALQAAFELGRRKATQDEIKRLNAIVVSNSRTIFAQFNNRLSDLNHEELWCLYLSKNGRILGEKKISEGSSDSTGGDVKKIVSPAIELKASNVCLCHNHPHSTTRPSQDDRELTRKAKEALSLFDIRLLDHVIISDGRYFSFVDNGEI